MKLHIKSKKYFIAEIEGVLFGSKSKILVQDAIRQSGANSSNLLSNKSFLKVKETTSTYAVANLYYNFNHLTELADIYTEEKIQKNIFLNHFSGWAATDIFIKNNSFFANGLLGNRLACNRTGIKITVSSINATKIRFKCYIFKHRLQLLIWKLIKF